MSEYILTKKFFLEWGLMATKINKELNFVNARLEHVYGPNDSRLKFIPSVIYRLKENHKSIELTSCKQKRDFIYVDDVVRALILILENRENPALKGFSEISVGTGRATSLKKLVQIIKDLTCSSTILEYGALRFDESESVASKADTKKLKSLGWKCKISLVDGLRLTVRNAEINS
jgi:nucleoside-diphosphate-sugar epimerase